MAIDLSNPSVLKNFLYGQMLERKGEFYEKTSVLVFKDEHGAEYIVPEDLVKKLEESELFSKKKPGRPKKEEEVTN